MHYLYTTCEHCGLAITLTFTAGELSAYWQEMADGLPMGNVFCSERCADDFHDDVTRFPAASR